MTEPQTPLVALSDLAASEASGEFVAVSATCEWHVYLQSGRVAWATDSTRQFAFSRHLLDHTSLTTEVLQEVLEVCRRDRLPLGETLLAWGVVTLEQIRAGLIHQISEALRSLREATVDRTIFLERRRQFSSYDTNLTFDLHALVPSASVPRIPVSTVPQGVDPTAILDEVRPLIPDAAWLEVLDGEMVIERDPNREESFVSTDLLRHTVLDGADVVAIRTARDTVLGVRLAHGDRTLWCRLEADKAFGSTLAALCRFAQIATGINAAPPAGDEHVRAVRVLGSRQGEDGAEEARALMDRAPEVGGVLFLENDALLGGAVRPDVDPEHLRAIAHQRALALETLGGSPAEGKQELEERGYSFRSLGTGEETFWCFGTEISKSLGRTLWLFTDRTSSQGLGWAYVTALARELGQMTRDKLAATG